MKVNETTALVVAPIAADVVSDINWQTGETEDDVDAILAKYLGREDALFARLEQKYAAPSPARASPAPKAASPSPAKAPKSTNKKAHDAKQDARAAMEARLNARLARKK